jgi:predicted AlkP superfamily phosphohydrolase/phosphomutase
MTNRHARSWLAITCLAESASHWGPVFRLAFVAFFLCSAVFPASAAQNSVKLYWFIPDGTRADPEVFDVFRFAREGRYPNIKKMMERGAYGYSIPTYPSHTPTNFATLLTGAYPEIHGVADGPMRIEGHPLARPALQGFSSTARKVPAIWQTLEEAGRSVAVVSVPGSTPPELDAGIVIRGRWSGWGPDFFAVNFESEEGGGRAGRGLDARLFLQGPELTRFVKAVPASGWKKAPRSYTPPREITMTAHGATLHAYVYDATDDGRANYSAVIVSKDKTTPLAVLGDDNDWSEWLPVTLRWNEAEVPSSMKVCRVKLEPDGRVKLRIYYDLLNRLTMVPPEMAVDIRERIGPMADFVDNWPAQLNQEPADKAVWMTEADLAMSWHKRLVEYMFEAARPEVLIHDTYVPNQLLESRWWLRYVDPASHGYAQTAEAERADAWREVHAYYRKLDEILGEALSRADEDAVIVFSSDHGIIPLNHSVLLNNLFAREGLLFFSLDPNTGEPTVDWAKTKAIHLKMHGVYVHPDGLAGPWKRGNGRDYERLRRRVMRLIRDLRDENGRSPFRKILPREKARSLRLPLDRVADIILVMEPGYGLSEKMDDTRALFEKPLQSGYKQALGADDTAGLWTPFVIVGPGVRTGYKLRKPIRHVDQAPTLLRLLNVPIPGHMQGRVLEEIFEK